MASASVPSACDCVGCVGLDHCAWDHEEAHIRWLVISESAAGIKVHGAYRTHGRAHDAAREVLRQAKAVVAIIDTVI